MQKIADSRTPCEKIRARKAALWAERQSFEPVWKDLSKHYLPRTGRFLSTERNKSTSSTFNKILDNTPTIAARTLAAGMMSGMSSPARPWFRLATPDAELMKQKPVQLWLDNVQNLMRAVFQRSNMYRVLHQIYLELGVYGTAAAIILPDFDNIIHAHSLTIGEYAIACDSKGRANTLYREFDMTVHALVTEFGYDNCSVNVQQLYDGRKYDQWVTVLHAIEPRDVRGNTLMASKKPWASVYMESNSREEKFLREGGFDYFPAICPRWDVSGGDIYGTSPGMEALGDNKQLQFNQKKKAKVIDYQADPPVQIPVQLRDSPYGLDLTPGGENYYDQSTPGGGIRTAYEVNTRIDGVLNDIMDIRERINGAFYANLFLMLANDTRSNITATEVSERHEEKMLMLGPVLERLHNEIHEQLIDIVFAQIMAAKVNGKPLVPPPPEEMRGMELKVDFISVLAQAQKAVGVGALQGAMQTFGMIGQFDPSAIQNKVDFEQIVDVYADLAGLNPTIIRDDNEVQKMKEAAAAAQQQAMAMQRMQAMAPAANQTADAIKKFADIPEDQRQQMTAAMQGLSGYGMPA